MALKVLMLRSKLTPLQAAMEQLRQTEAGFATREAELEADIAAASTDEERTVVEQAVTSFEAERSANAAEITRVQGEIDAINEQIRSLEQAQTPPAQTGTQPAERTVNTMATETRSTFFGLTIEQRDAMFAREDVKAFLQRARQLGQNQRSVSGAELGIPEAFMPILRDETYKQSKLLKYVTVQPIKGRARQNIAGTVPEAIWTEMLGSVNEIELSFNQIEMDGYMVAAYTAVPNADLEDDSDLQLATSILLAMGEAIGRAIDKAIVYGTGTKMPVGFVTRLAASVQPIWWGSNQGAFTDLHSSNVLKLNIDSSTGATFFAALVAALGVAAPNYSDGKAVWIMNRKTHIKLMTKALAFDSAAALVSGVNNEMPIVGGAIEELEFMADNEICGGFLSLERLAERAGASIASSDIPLFLQNQTLYKALARYDGKPARGEGFVLVNYANTDPTTTISFAQDYANTGIGTLIVTTAAGTASGDTCVTIAGAPSGATTKYKLAGEPIGVRNGQAIGTGWTAVATGDDVTAATGSYITVVEVDAKGKAVKVGSGVVTAKP